MNAEVNVMSVLIREFPDMFASASSFGSKVARGLGASLVGWINGLTGFVGNMEVVTPRRALRHLYLLHLHSAGHAYRSVPHDP